MHGENLKLIAYCNTGWRKSYLSLTGKTLNIYCEGTSEPLSTDKIKHINMRRISYFMHQA